MYFAVAKSGGQVAANCKDEKSLFCKAMQRRRLDDQHTSANLRTNIMVGGS